VRVGLEKIVYGHPRRERLEDESDGDPSSADNRLSSKDARIACDEIFH
jgi:hypothetical protein